MQRRNLIRCGLAALALGSAVSASAQTYPSKSIKIVVAYAPGGSTDNLARQLGVALGEKLGQTVIVENKPGGSTVIAAQALISAPADGYTLAIFDPSTVSMNQHLFKRPSYDPEKSIAPVGMLVRIPFGLMVQSSSPINSVRDFVANAKAKPGTLSFGHSGAGNPVHLSGELFKNAAGIDMVQVSYKGGAPAIQDLLGGQIPAMFMDVPSSIQHVKAGRIKVLAVTTPKRSEQLPDVPTIAESGYPGFDSGSWFGVFAPTGTPPAVIAKLNAAIRDAMSTPQMTTWVKGQSFEMALSTPEELAATVKSDSAKYGSIIKKINFSLDN